MRHRIACAVAVIVALAIRGAAIAQGFGLDLTREGPNLEPSVAIVTTTRSEEEAGRARAVDRALAEIATARHAFSRVVAGEQLRDLLKGADAPRRDCREASCLTELSHQLGVDRLLIAELDSGALHVVAFDWAGGVLVEKGIESQALGSGSLTRRLEPHVLPLLQKLSTPLGELVVTTNLEATKIRWGGRLIAEGRSFSGAVPSGTHPVTVTSDGYQPYEETVTVAPGGKAEVEAELQAQTAISVAASVEEEEFEPKRRPKPQGKVLWQRPGLYAAVAGAAVLSVGLAFGGAANSVKSKLVDADGDGLMDNNVTRAEALAAQRNAVLANVFGTIGVLGMGAGVGWLVFFDGPESGAAPKMGVLVSGNF
jgi:hypothetical protein